MLKRVSRVFVILAVLSVILLSNPQTAQAIRWFLRDNETYVNPVRVCRDGIELGVGKREDNPPPEVTVYVLAQLQPTSALDPEILLNPGNTEFTVPYDPFFDPDYGYTITHRTYITIPWSPADGSLVPLAPGSMIALTHPDADPSQLIPPAVIVEDCLLAGAGPPFGAAITYQGFLADGESPADGAYDFRFRLYDGSTGGSQVGGAVTKGDIPVSAGVFSAELDFGQDAYDGARWLEVGVRPAGSEGDFTILSPRQKLNPVPYALNAANVAAHDHMGETWIGNAEPLTIEGSFFREAPLILKNYNGDGHGLDVYSVPGNSLAAYFDGDIEVTGQCTGCTLAAFGINSGETALQPGDIVAVQGVQAITADNASILMDVSLAASGQAVVGVVLGRAELASIENPQPGETGQRLVKSEGPSQPGEYVTIVTYGLAQVRVSSGSGTVAAGARLAAGAGGAGRTLQTTEVNGVQLSESAPVVGIALEPAPVDGLIWVLVNPQ